MSKTITTPQRKLFFRLVNKYGKEAIYLVLYQVTKCISLRDPNLTPGKMTDVFVELSSRYSFDTPPIVKQGENEIYLITTDQKNAINSLKKTAKLDDPTYHAICQKEINLREPMTRDQANEILIILNSVIQEKYRSKHD